MACESPAKKARREVNYLMNINEAVDKSWEDKSLAEIAEAPISALQGLADWTDAEFAKLGLSSIYELGTWKYFLWARAMCKLGDTEVKDDRQTKSRMNMNNALDKAHEGKHLKEILKLPPSALQGLAEWVDEPLAKLHVKTIEKLGKWKFAEWANAIAILYDLEQNLPPSAAEKKPAKNTMKATKPDAKSRKADAASKSEIIAAAAGQAALDNKEFADDLDGREFEVISHHNLVSVDVSKDEDKFMVLQIVKAGDDKYFFLIRWGRTGTRGQKKVDGPLSTLDEVEELLAAKFKEKTGQDVESVEAGTFVHVEGKYDLVKGDDRALRAPRNTRRSDGGCIWQYYVDDGVDGKKTGWYDYAEEAAEHVEEVYVQWLNNQQLQVRSVQSDNFCYQINFNEMMQTNVTHPSRTQRKIRRNV